MHTVFELWRPTDQWAALSADERGDYMQKLGEGMAEFDAAGIECVG